MARTGKPRGGARAGAGRKPGKKNTVASNKSRKIVLELVASGDMTPLEVMLAVMKAAVAKKNWVLAMSAAKDAAPYVHPRLANTTLKGDADAPVAVTFVDNIPNYPKD